MREPVTAYVGLGANLGDAAAAVEAALAALDALPGTERVARSALYLSAPQDASGPDFINAVAALRTRLSAPDLLRALLDLEAQAGRQRPYPNAPRTLDLDLLLYGDARIESTELVVPHPRMQSRAFVLLPLAEIAPSRVTSASLAAVAGQAVRRLPPTPGSQAEWLHDGLPQRARWRSEAGRPPPARIVPADDQLPADQAYRMACEGTALLWQGDFHNARQLLQALSRRVDRKPRKAGPATAQAPAQAFHRHRQAQGRRAAILSMLLVPLEGDYRIPLRRAPDLRAACEEAWGPPDGSGSVVALRELLGLVGAHEWRRKGVEVPVLGGTPAPRIHPHYGVFSPVRGEYLDLVATQPLPDPCPLAWDIGTGTGVIAAILARRGVPRVIATDTSPRALACARDNLGRLGLAERVELVQADLFPPGRASLIVCNPPWLPARPTSMLEHAVYDPDSAMLRGFLAGVASRLEPGAQAWLILSDLAEHLGLRTREQLLAWIGGAGLVVRGRRDLRPRHGKASDPGDPLASARSRELTSLWRLAAA